MAKSIAAIDAQIEALRQQRRDAKRAAQREERQRVQRAQQQLGVDLAKAVGATSEEQIERLREELLNREKVQQFLKQRLGADSATEAAAEERAGGGHHGDH